jgi:protein-S-isoprenylcysteine O-methyltransferase Ste14
MSKFFARNRSIIPRILLIILLSPLAIYFSGFYEHFYIYLTGGIITNVIVQQWHIVLISIGLFVALLVPLSYRRKADWKEYGLATAFFVSLFVEMYGIPLTILLTANYFFVSGISMPDNLIAFNFLGVSLGMDIGMTYGAIMMIIGACIIAGAWITLYKNIKKKGLVDIGIYSYSRHPQYFGFILVIIGWFIAWPTILTLFFTPVLVYKYLRLCSREEREIAKEFPKYKKYKENVPFFI